MLLAIDVGNSNVVLGLYDLPLETPAAAWRITTPRTLTADEFGVLLANLFTLRNIDRNTVDAIVISSVVPPFDGVLLSACELNFNVKPLFIDTSVDTGIAVLTDHPEELGADRLVNCVAAHHRYDGAHPVIVVDMGTATTFDVLSAAGEFLGGAIAPGLGISAEALFARAARLPRIEIKKPVKVIGTDTIDNLQIGLYYGYIGLIDGILERMIAELGPETKTIGTGGLARLIAGGSRFLHEVDDDLTLTGLRLVWQRQAASKEPRSGSPA